MRKCLCIIITVLVMTEMIEVNSHAGNFTNTNMYCKIHLEILKKNYKPDDEDWELLVKKANEDAISEWNKSKSALDKETIRNLEKWGHRDKEALIIKNDSIFFRVFYPEMSFDATVSRGKLKEILGELLQYRKINNTVKKVFDKMAQHNKELYFLMVSDEEQRIRIIPYGKEDYKRFGSKAK